MRASPEAPSRAHPLRACFPAGGLWESATEDHEGMAGVSEAAKMLYAMSPNSYVNEVGDRGDSPWSIHGPHHASVMQSLQAILLACMFTFAMLLITVCASHLQHTSPCQQ